jgi:hypothetical protein
MKDTEVGMNDGRRMATATAADGAGLKKEVACRRTTERAFDRLCPPFLTTFL